MEQVKDSLTKTEYLYNNTLYQVKSVFKDAPKTERLEDKIRRLILNDQDTKPPAA